jgi:hypothetical protein
VKMLMFAIPVFMVTILVEAAIAWRMGRRGVYDVPDAITSLHHGVLSQAIGGFAKLIADSDEVARAFRDDVARCSEMMSPGVRCLAGG